MTALRNLAVKSLPVLVLALTAGILFAHYQQIAQIKKKAFEALVLDTQHQEKTELKRLFDPVNINLSIISRWLQTDSTDLGDAVALNARLMPILQEVTQVSSAMVADSDGREYMLLRTAEGWLTRLSGGQKQGGGSRWNRWTDPGKSVEAWTDADDYDPRKRPWFRGVVDSGAEDAVFWTSPYPFFTTREPGITAARKWVQAGQQGKFTVVAFDVLLTDISALTRRLGSGNRGKAFVLTGDGRVVGIPDDPQFRTPSTARSSVLSHAGEFPVRMVRDAYAAWLAGGRAVGEPFVFESDKAVWWASFWNYSLGNESLWLAVAVPEAELVSRIGSPGYGIPVTITGIGMMMFLASLVVMRKLQRGDGDRGRSNDALDVELAGVGEGDAGLEGRVLALIHLGESERLEFKSSVRWNFKAGRPGKEMELAWLKTVVAYLNSEGGVVLLGVNDAGEILGLDKDGFANDDQALRHIENLVARHIGSAYFRYIRSRLVTVQDSKVLMIMCSAAPKPVFLKHDKGEDFYIRTGPASRSLAPSEVLAYIETRKQP